MRTVSRIMYDALPLADYHGWRKKVIKQYGSLSVFQKKMILNKVEIPSAILYYSFDLTKSINHRWNNTYCYLLMLECEKNK